MKFYPAWAEVNLNSLDENILDIAEEVGKDVKIAPVLKHDAFGHGAVVVAKRLMQFKNVAMFCLETVDECLRLRQENIELPLLLLSDFYEKELPLIAENDITVSVYRYEAAEILNKFAKKSGKQCRIHLRIDTDEECDGIPMEEFKETYDKIQALKNIKVEGVYTHIYSDYSKPEEPRIKEQIEDFESVVASIPEKRRRNLLIHAAGSECIYKYPQSYFDMVRPGLTMFFKLKPVAAYEQGKLSHSLEIKPIMKIKARVEAIYNVDAGVKNCLGRADLSEDCKRVADLSIGWWDACYLFMEKGGYATIRGAKVPVIVSSQMDRILIDVTKINDVQVEDEVTLLGEPEANIAASREDLEFYNFKRILHTGERMPKKYTNWSENAVEFPTFALYHIRRELPKLNELLGEYGNKTLEQYLASLNVMGSEGFAPKEDLAEAAYGYALPLFGEDVANEVREYFLSPDCLVYTANHHEADFDANQIQSNLIYYRYLQRQGRNSTIVPMLSCAGVDMSSSTYPRGIMCYSTAAPKMDNDMQILHLPVYNSQYSNMVVLDTPAFSREMIGAMAEGLKKNETKAFLTGASAKVIADILSECYMDEETLGAPSYAAQASLINRKLQKKLINGKTSPDFIYIPMESVVADLTIKDLSSEASPAYRILFDDKIRGAVTTYLDGETGCWTYSALQEMAENPRAKSSVRHHGSHFFWGINEQHRRFPILLVEKDGNQFMSGITGEKDSFLEPFTPENVIRLLREKKIYPGVFMIMFSLKFARGFALAGGCFQIEYTRKMKNGLYKALRRFPELSAVAEEISLMPDDQYLNGPMFGMAEDAFGGYVQAGPVEILERGGIKEDEFHRLLNISFHDAAMIGTLTMYSEVFAQPDRMKNWHSELSGGLERLYEQLCLSKK